MFNIKHIHTQTHTLASLKIAEEMQWTFESLQIGFNYINKCVCLKMLRADDEPNFDAGVI